MWSREESFASIAQSVGDTTSESFAPRSSTKRDTLNYATSNNGGQRNLLEAALGRRRSDTTAANDNNKNNAEGDNDNDDSYYDFLKDKRESDKSYLAKHLLLQNKLRG